MCRGMNKTADNEQSRLSIFRTAKTDAAKQNTSMFVHPSIERSTILEDVHLEDASQSSSYGSVSHVKETLSLDESDRLDCSSIDTFVCAQPMDTKVDSDDDDHMLKEVFINKSQHGSYFEPTTHHFSPDIFENAPARQIQSNEDDVSPPCFIPIPSNHGLYMLSR